MNATITELGIALNILENNEPINRAEGNIEQADLEAASAVEIRDALSVLRQEVL